MIATILMVGLGLAKPSLYGRPGSSKALTSDAMSLKTSEDEEFEQNSAIQQSHLSEVLFSSNDL